MARGWTSLLIPAYIEAIHEPSRAPAPHSPLSPGPLGLFRWTTAEPCSVLAEIIVVGSPTVASLTRSRSLFKRAQSLLPPSSTTPCNRSIWWSSRASRLSSHPPWPWGKAPGARGYSVWKPPRSPPPPSKDAVDLEGHAAVASRPRRAARRQRRPFPMLSRGGAPRAPWIHGLHLRWRRGGAVPVRTPVADGGAAKSAAAGGRASPSRVGTLPCISTRGRRPPAWRPTGGSRPGPAPLSG